MADTLIPVAAAAKQLGVSRNYVYDCIGRGEIPYINLGHGRAKVRVRQSAVDAFIDRRDSAGKSGGKPQLRSVEDVA